MKNVLLTVKFSDEEIEKLRTLANVEYISEKQINQLDVKDIDILICYNPFKRVHFKDIDLKYIQLLSVGIDHLPEYIKNNKNLIISNNKGAYSTSISEWTIGRILEVLKNFRYNYDNQKKKEYFIDFNLLDLFDKRVLIFGTGMIARKIAKRLNAFDTFVAGMNTSGAEVEYFNEIYTKDNLFLKLNEYDIVINTLPNTEDNYHFINEELISKLKEDTILVNVSRGTVVDEKSLIKNIKKFKAVILDVFEKEPLSKDSPLWTFENVYISAHNSWVSNNMEKDRFMLAYYNLKRYLDGLELINIVDPNRGY